jgi:nicotinate-nucleotide adenylyltransferase
LILAEHCREQVQLDRVLFVPAAISPLKVKGPVASAKHRLQMLQLATSGRECFDIYQNELQRTGPSFTVDTLQEIKLQHPEAELFLLIGQDSLQTFGQWKQPETICNLATPLVVRRPMFDSPSAETQVLGTRSGDSLSFADLSSLRPFADTATFERARQFAIRSRWIDISSTEIRERVARGMSIRYLVPRAVEKYIETNSLYL